MLFNQALHNSEITRPGCNRQGRETFLVGFVDVCVERVYQGSQHGKVTHLSSSA
jgi:hypothetical protein